MMLRRKQVPHSPLGETTRFIRQLGEFRGRIPKRTLSTIRGQALAGDLEGARRGLEKAIILMPKARLKYGNTPAEVAAALKHMKEKG